MRFLKLKNKKIFFLYFEFFFINKVKIFFFLYFIFIYFIIVFILQTFFQMQQIAVAVIINLIVTLPFFRYSYYLH